MPTITNPNLTLSESDGRVTIEVEYDATASAFERQLVGLGLDYHTHVAVFDFDGGDTLGAMLVDFPREDIPFTAGAGEQVLRNRVERLTVDRADLKGDPANNDDELKARIKVHAPGLLEFTEDVISDQEILAD